MGIFLSLRLISISTKETPVTYKIDKPTLPPPGTIIPTHPWLLSQPFVQEANLEIKRDLEKIRHLSEQLPNLSEEELTNLMMTKLLALQATIPFTFPNTFYNVLCISASEGQIPAPFCVFKRLYLGETELGLPLYMDVRVYDLDSAKSEEIMTWHLNALEGNREELHFSEQRKAFLCRGKQNSHRKDTTHGFAALQGDRGLFLDFYSLDNRLYVCYAEAPLVTFTKYESIFRNLIPIQTNKSVTAPRLKI